MTDIPQRAQVVVIGGGAIGTSTAYHLTKLGITDQSWGRVWRVSRLPTGSRRRGSCRRSSSLATVWAAGAAPLVSCPIGSMSIDLRMQEHLRRR